MKTKKERVGAIALDASYVFIDSNPNVKAEEYLTENEKTHTVFNLYINDTGKDAIDGALHFMKYHAPENVFAVALSSEGFNVEFSDPATADVEPITSIWLEVHASGEIVAYVDTEAERYGIIIPYDDLVADMDRE